MYNIMEKNRFIYNIFLAAGLLSFITGIILFFILPANQFETYNFFMHVVILFAAIAIVYFSVILNKAFAFYISVNVAFAALMLLVMSALGREFSLVRFWPVFLMFFGITLIPAGRIKYHRFKTIYVVPSSCMFFMGAFFILFSFKIIKVSLRTVVSYSMPVFLILCGLVLITLYCIRSKSADAFSLGKSDDDIPSGNDIFCEDD